VTAGQAKRTNGNASNSQSPVLHINAQAVRDKLQAALEVYTDARPERFALWKENKKNTTKSKNRSK
jgi:hypothetical protein